MTNFTPKASHTDKAIVQSTPSSDVFERFHFDELARWMNENQMHSWAKELRQQVCNGLDTTRFGDLPKWLSYLEAMPDINTENTDLINGVTLNSEQLSESHQQKLKQALEGLIPWRKGPYSVHGIDIDTEWRSDWKWNRLLPHIAPLTKRTVLDVGCGNGYHMWRMLGEGAQRVIGVDPSPRFSVQFEMIKQLIGKEQPVHLVPCAMEDVPRPLKAFDTVFSMGVLYHRKSPIDHLYELKDALVKGGQLILETLVVEGNETTCLIPQNRYAKMRNVWFLPSSQMLTVWLKRIGFSDIQIVDTNQTTTEEQRATDWMKFESLSDFLNPEAPNQTIEGHPAPLRAVITAIL